MNEYGMPPLPEPNSKGWIYTHEQMLAYGRLVAMECANVSVQHEAHGYSNIPGEIAAAISAKFGVQS